MNYIITTLGCKVNQYETQAMETLLQRRGHRPAGLGEPVHAVLVNTCAVTAESERKSRQAARHLLGEYPEAVLAVCGCYSQMNPEKAEELGARVVFGSGDREEFVLAVERAVLEGQRRKEIDAPFQRRAFERLPAGAVDGRTRAMLKIQDGCVNFCSYCIIPYSRGRLRSMPVADAAAETERLSALGFRELVLTGIEVASYGLDLPDKPGLGQLVETVAAHSGPMRLRLGSLEPTVITEDFCRRLAGTGKVCRHFHLSLQSGCDRTLKAMNRKYDTAGFTRAVELLCAWFPGCALTCDLITGFPGETEEDHRQTLAFIERCGFAAMHVFPYSRRPGTPADKMPDQLSAAVKERRAAQARAVGERTRRSFLDGSLGLVLPVLFETEKEGFCAGHSDTYLPVRAPGTGLRGQVLDVRVKAVENSGLLGEIV